MAIEKNNILNNLPANMKELMKNLDEMQLFTKNLAQELQSQLDSPKTAIGSAHASIKKDGESRNIS